MFGEAEARKHIPPRDPMDARLESACSIERKLHQHNYIVVLSRMSSKCNASLMASHADRLSERRVIDLDSQNSHNFVVRQPVGLAGGYG